ncbi:hypothetical protein KUCAC02_018509 [Chaenocephalus aceratus]|uniref:Uncharacterized protein n=1 Tax=Chaenocephalus aceratus TaxID=36190 RepID=A0ACB9W8P3_CHAAC|nr:hypothetical protein KUCAC02_018509 [Chaenocephalus aceratus]
MELHARRHGSSHSFPPSRRCLCCITRNFLQIGMVCNITNTTYTTNSTCRVDTLEGLAYCPVFLLGFFLNAAALRAFFAKRGSWTDTHIYMLNLAIADSTLILFLPLRIYNAFICLPVNHVCTFLIFTHYINMYASILTTTAISVQRYLVIRFPLQARSWRKKKEVAFAVCLILWGLILTISAIFHKDNHPEKLSTCYERCKNIHLSPVFIVIMVVCGYLAPLLIVVFCSSRIISILLKVDDKSEEKKRTIGIVTANMIVFIFCYTPIHVGFVVNYEPPVNWQFERLPVHVYLHVAEWIASTNCCFDSVSYSFLLMRFFRK